MATHGTGIGKAAGAVGNAAGNAAVAAAGAFGPEAAAAAYAVKEAAGKAVEMLEQLSNAMISWVSKSNPGVIAQYNQALDNLSASLGKMFEPFVSTFVPWIDGLNAAFTDMAQGVKPLTDAMALLSASLAEMFSSAINSIHVAGSAFQLLGDVMKEWARWALYVAAAIQVLSGTGPEDRKKTVAATPSSFAAAEEIGKQFRLAALNSQGGTNDPQVATANELKEIRKTVQQLYDTVSKIVGTPEQLKKDFQNALPAIQWPFS